MDKFDKVEKLREKAGVSYEDAKNALEACEYDMLDAIIYLEKEGKIPDSKANRYETDGTENDKTAQEFAKAQADYEKSVKDSSFAGTANKFFDWCGRVLKKSIDTSFVIKRRENQIVKVPVLVLILALFFAFWIIVPLLIVGLFCECRYHFEGIDSVNIDINDMCDKAADSVDNMKNSSKKYEGK